MGKDFEKQIKTIKEQGQKQVEVLKDLKPKEQTKAIADKSDDKLSMQKETDDRLLNEKLNEIQEVSKKVDYNNLTYYFKDPRSSSINFIKFKGLFVFFFEKIKNDDLSLEEPEKRQKDF